MERRGEWTGDFDLLSFVFFTVKGGERQTDRNRKRQTEIQRERE